MEPDRLSLRARGENQILTALMYQRQERHIGPSPCNDRIWLRR
jgi:hypothetical protein